MKLDSAINSPESLHFLCYPILCRTSLKKIEREWNKSFTISSYCPYFLSSFVLSGCGHLKISTFVYCLQLQQVLVKIWPIKYGQSWFSRSPKLYQYNHFYIRANKICIIRPDQFGLTDLELVDWRLEWKLKFAKSILKIS